MAEFTSRSKTAPQAEHTHSLTGSPAHPEGPVKAPQDEQILVEFLESGSTYFLPQELLLYEKILDKKMEYESLTYRQKFNTAPKGN